MDYGGKIMDEQDLAEKLLDELKDEGYKTFQERNRNIQFKRALAEYESKMSNPYEY